MIIYNENKELILKDNFREFHLINSGFGFIQKNTIADIKKLFSSFEESENDTENLKAAYHALKEEVKKTSVYRDAACRSVSRKLDSLLPKEKEFINKKAFIDIVKFEKRFLRNWTNGNFDLITSGPVALVYAADERIVFDGIEKRESTFKGLAESFENSENRYFSVDTKTFKNMVKIYNDIPISLNENLAINPKLFKNIVKFFNFTKQKTIHCCISADCLRVKFWNDSFVLVLCPFDFKAENPESLNFYGFTELAENPSADPRALPSLLPLPGNPDYMRGNPAPVIATEKEEKEIAESENCIDGENHNPANCPEFAENGIISAENENIFSFYGTQLLSPTLICCHALRLHSLRAYLAGCLYMHLSACSQIAKWMDKSFFDTS